MQETLQQPANCKPTGRRHNNRAGKLRRIEVAALTLFVERGIDEVTVEDIATASQISRRTFFRHFPSKFGVLAAVHEREMRRMFDEFRIRPADEPFIEAYVAASKIAATMHEDSDEHLVQDLAFQLLERYPDAWKRIVEQSRDVIEAGLTEVIAIRNAALGLDPTIAPMLAVAVWAITSRLYLNNMRRDNNRQPLFDRVRQALGQIAAHLHQH